MRDLLILVIIVGLIPYILMRPWIGVLAWYWIGLMSPHRLGWGFIVNAPVAMAIGAVTLMALVFTKDRRPIPMTREMIMLGVWATYMTMTTFFAWHPNPWGQWDMVMKILLMTFVTPMLVFGRTRIVLLVLVVTLSIAFYGFKGGLFSLLTGGAHHVLGPRGTFIGGNTNLGLGMLMVLPLILISARMFAGRWVDLGILNRWSRLISYGLYGVFWLTCVAIVFTYSRGALLGIAAIAPFVFLKMRRKFTMILAAVMAVSVIGVTMPEQLVNRAQTIQTYDEDHSAMQRFQAWGVSWNIAVENPILGTGFHTAGIGNELWLSYANWIEPWASSARAAHSVYFQVLGHHGFGGLGVFLTLIAFTMLTLNRIRREARGIPGSEWMAEFAWAIMVGMVAFLVAGAFLDLAYFDLLYVYIALAVIMRRELEEQAAKMAAGTLPEQNQPSTADKSRPAIPGFVVSSDRSFREDRDN